MSRVIILGYTHLKQPMTSSADRPSECQVAFDERAGYLYAFVSCQHGNLDVARSYWHKIAEKALSISADKVLVVEDIPESISIAEVHQLVTELAELPVRSVRVAFVDRFAQHKSINDFGILVGGNRGLTVKGFDSTDPAEKWLLA